MTFPLNYKLDDAFKFGCGRFRQEYGLLAKCADEIARLGTHPLFVCTDTSADIALPIVQKSLGNAHIPLKALKYNGFCSPSAAERFVTQGFLDGIDIVIGCGGGVILDFSKLIADFTRLPLVTIPTSSATCAAYTPLSVCYDDDGKSLGSPKYKWEIAAALLDMDILSAQPPRLLASGALDAMAKKIEIEQRLVGLDADELAPGFASCHVLADFIYSELDRKLETACDDLRNGRRSKTIEDVVYYSIVDAGLISGLANGRNQSAIAHKFYLFVRTFFTKEAASFLHGELVAIGLVAQLHYNGDHEGSKAFAKRLHVLGLPASLNELNLPATPKVLDDCYQFILSSSAMVGAPADGPANLLQALQTIILL
ncbi:MAG: iron-containing alcohol dehydrogenase [Victivallales bacterium]|nr:iron-containing alcohol dehydrogenase [Victivallales bacterium]